MNNIIEIIEKKFSDKKDIMNHYYIRTNRNTYLELFDILTEPGVISYYCNTLQNRNFLIKNYTDNPVVFFRLWGNELSIMYVDNILSSIHNRIIESEEIIKLFRYKKIEKIKKLITT
jgi:hypothetical protein